MCVLKALLGTYTVEYSYIQIVKYPLMNRKALYCAPTMHHGDCIFRKFQICLLERTSYLHFVTPYAYSE